MAWRSLFAFSNPNGRIGSQYTGIFNTSAVGPLSLSSQQVRNIYSFTLKPGVYSINLQYILVENLSNPTYTNLSSGVSTSPTSSALYPNYFNISNPTTSTGIQNATYTSTFLVSVTEANPTIYINLYYLYTSGSLNILDNNYWYCVATKLA
jgi:hypothetical protein